MKYTIGICDDDQIQVDLIKEYLLTCDVKDELVIIDETNPTIFLNKIEEKYPQLIFLDIDMGESSGIDIGKQIHEFDENIVIVYITAYEKYAFDAYQTRAFHYLLKPVTLLKFNKVLLEAMNYVETLSHESEKKTFVIKTKQEIVCIEQDDIYYFEKTGHKIRVCAKTRDVYYYDNFTRLVEDIDEEDFVRCHQGYIVNIDKIRAFRNKTLFLAGDFELPVSRSYMAY